MMRRLTWIAVALWVALLLASPVRAAPTVAAPPDLYRIYFSDWADLSRLSGELDVWEVNHTEHYLVAPLLADQAAAIWRDASDRATTVARLARHSRRPRLRPTASPAMPAIARSPKPMPPWTNWPRTYPDLAQVVDIGDTWDKMTPGGPDGYDLRVLVLTSNVYADTKPSMFLMGGIHARELTTSETALRFAETPARRLWHGPGRHLDVGLRRTPRAGLRQSGRAHPGRAGRLWRKNTNNADGCHIRRTVL